MTSTFKRDVPIGEKAEREFASLLLTSRADVTSLTFNKNKDYDIKVSFLNGDVVTYEVKYDIRSSLTGNVAVETFSRGKQSGLSTSLADKWVYNIYVHSSREHLWVEYSRENLVKLLETQEFKVMNNAGDLGSGTNITLIPCDVFVRHCDAVLFKD